jgi:hypothetical protein
MSEGSELCTVTAGVIRVGTGVKFKRARGAGGHVTARGISSDGRFLYCTDARTMARVVRLNEVYWVGAPPSPQKQRDLVTSPRGVLRRRRRR